MRKHPTSTAATKKETNVFDVKDPNDGSSSNDQSVGSDEVAVHAAARDSVFEELSALTSRQKAERARSLRRQTPRVIGTKIEKKEKEPKGAHRFAKKVVAPEPEPEPEPDADVPFFLQVRSSSPPPPPDVESDDVPFFLQPAPKAPSPPPPTQVAPPCDVPDATSEGTIIADLFRELQTSLDGILKDVAAARGDHQPYEAAQSRLLDLLDEAVSVTNEVPPIFEEHERTAKTQLPAWRRRAAELSSRLSDEQTKLQTDRDSVTLARAQNSAAIEAARIGLSHRKSQYSDRAASLESRIRDATGPLTARLREIDDEKLAHERAVEDLYREIERRKEAIADLEREYEERLVLLDVAEQRFADDRRQLEAAAADLAREDSEVEEKVRQIEAPYQNLLDSIEERTRAVRGLEGQLRAAGATIGDLEKDVAQSSSISQIVQRLSRTLETTKAKRVELRRELESAAAALHEAEQSSHSPRASSDRNLRSQAAKALETSQLLKQKVAQLSQDKASAIRAKNFVAAKRISQQLKEGEEQLAVAEQNLAAPNQTLEAMDAEESQTRGAVRSAKQKVDDLSYDILATNYNFYESAIAVLDGLFELSPYGRKLLNPLQALLLAGIAYVDAPPKLDVDEVQRRIQELNTKLEAVVAKEDFETAATIQEDIDRLAARLAK